MFKLIQVCISSLLIKQINIIDCLWPVTQKLSVVLKHPIFVIIEMRWYVYATMFLFIDHLLRWEEINLIKASRFMSSASVYTEKKTKQNSSYDHEAWNSCIPNDRLYMGSHIDANHVTLIKVIMKIAVHECAH